MSFFKDQSKLMGTVTSKGQIHFHPLNDKPILQVPLSKPTLRKFCSLAKFQIMLAIIEGHMNFKNAHFLKIIAF